jgi:hypothetical protein
MSTPGSLTVCSYFGKPRKTKNKAKLEGSLLKPTLIGLTKFSSILRRRLPWFYQKKAHHCAVSSILYSNADIVGDIEHYAITVIDVFFGRAEQVFGKK